MMARLGGRFVCDLLIGLGWMAWGAFRVAGQQSTPGAGRGHGTEQKDMNLLGHHDLQARSAYQPTIHQ